ncbi:type II secretion system F family protein [Ferrimonas balearica]|uniref:type II secretion system F family protein n=1 Tax=Ferrimonas balearica TaxID=44012 RepID=UPI001C993E2B|nr:type II secretion system F family protein [Ferrimonas balearica]MBY5922505.1 type II secretion system F family protein [Ferrimonas balearica]MBY5995489.1 type II secretion system F family protein [Ferrimonas balearica]
MAHFRYRGRDETGTLVDGVVEAVNESAAADMLMRRAIIPLNLNEVVPGREFNWRGLLARRLPLSELLMFTRQMLSLTRSGIPLLQALAGLVESQRHPLMASTLKDIVEQLTAGRPLSAALNQHPLVFTPLYVAMVHVGENTGRLDQAFERLSEHLEQEQDTKRRIQSAMRYPLLVLGFIAVAVAVLNILVIPKFAQMFAKFGAELPLPTRILIATSEFFVSWWPLLLLALVGGVIGIKVWLTTESGRLSWDGWKLRLPIVGSIISRASLGRFARSLSMMMRGGVPVNQSLSLVADAVDNRFMHDRIIGMRRGIEAGDTISRTASGAELFTPLVLQMISVGEETGRIDELLDDVAAFYEREVDYELKGLTAKIEPILLTLVAGMVLVLALGVYLPMWDMFNAVQGR